MVLSKFASDGTFVWVRYYGTANAIEESTGITLQSGTTSYLYVSGFGKTEPSAGVFKLDILIIRFTTDGVLDSSFKKIVASSSTTSNSMAMGISYYNNFLYVTGMTDSAFWQNAPATTNNDMFFLRFSTSTLTVNYLKSISGTDSDEGVRIMALSDGFVYALGNSISADLTNSLS